MAQVKAALWHFFTAVITLIRLTPTVALVLIQRYFKLGGFFKEGISVRIRFAEGVLFRENPNVILNTDYFRS